MDQNGVQDEEETDDQHQRQHHNCHRNFIRPLSSSSIRAHSWSLGLGADSSKDGEPDGHDCCCSMLLNESLEPEATHCCRCHDESTAALAVQDNNLVQPPQCPSFFVDIPTVYLSRKTSTNSTSFHVYQVSIRTSAGTEWSIYRRYSQFLALHQQLRVCDHAISKFSFPPKHRLNSKASTIVQERRRKLEEYMRNVCEYLVKRPAGGEEANLESVPYKLLTSLASNGPTKLPRSCSRSGSNSMHELASAGSGSLTDSARLEQACNEQDGGSLESTSIEQAIDVDEMNMSIDGNELNSQSSSSVVVEEADHLEPTPSRVSSPTSRATTTNRQDSKARSKSPRYLLYEFISPQRTNDAEFELDDLGV